MKTISENIADALVLESALRKCIEEINATDPQALGMGNNGNCRLGVMAYGHLSGIRKALSNGAKNYGVDPKDVFIVALREGECAFVQKSQVTETTTEELSTRLVDYLVAKFHKKGYIARFFNYLKKRF